MKIDIGHENSDPIQLRGEDRGFGPTVVLVHGWPQSSLVWERQAVALLAGGHRVVTYDRRGFGRSSRPSTGYDVDTLADDLDRVLTTLALTDCAIVGYASGCGDVIRYLGSYGDDRLRRAILIAPMPPSPGALAALPEADRPCSANRMRNALVDDRHAFLERFLDDTYNRGATPEPRISDASLRAQWADAVATAPVASLASLDPRAADFRDDLPRIGIPCLVLHGGADRVMPAAASSKPLADGIAGSTMRIIAGAPHGLLWTHAEEVNAALLSFVA